MARDAISGESNQNKNNQSSDNKETTIDHVLPRFAALDHLPPGYMMTGKLAIESQKTFLRLNIASLLLLVVGIAFFAEVDQLLRQIAIPVLINFPLADNNRILMAGIAAVLAITLLSVHELCHGLAYKLFGAKVRYGVNLRKAVAYASAKENYLTRDAYLIVGLAPLILITIVCIVGMAITDGPIRFLIALMGAVNIGASVGDVWFVVVCIRQQQTLLVRDYGDGAELYTPM